MQSTCALETTEQRSVGWMRSMSVTMLVQDLVGGWGLEKPPITPPQKKEKKRKAPLKKRKEIRN